MIRELASFLAYRADILQLLFQGRMLTEACRQVHLPSFMVLLTT